MKLGNIIEEGVLTEDRDPFIIQEAFDQYERMVTLFEALELLKTLDTSQMSDVEYNFYLNELDKFEWQLIELTEAALGNGTLITEAVQRQFRRYGDTFKRQYRCTTGQKQGRIVSSPEKCGIRKDPRRVRIGKKAARVKKGQRIRKTQFTKRKTQSKRVTRLNKSLRGDN